MNAELKAKWVAALRSGEYKQVRGILQQGFGARLEGFCCLGVLCKVNDPSLENVNDVTMPAYHPPFEGYSFIHRLVGEASEVETLVAMNDEEQASFEMIADYIERCIPHDEPKEVDTGTAT
jgi:hypothetical protein